MLGFSGQPSLAVACGDSAKPQSCTYTPSQRSDKRQHTSARKSVDKSGALCRHGSLGLGPMYRTVIFADGQKLHFYLELRD